MAARTRPQRGYARLPSWLYDRLLEPGTVRAASALLEEVARVAPPHGTVLDVGCGGGQALLALARRRPDLHLTGVDPSAALVAAASRRGGGAGIRVERASALDLPFDTGRFDVVLSLFAVKHWPDRRRGLAEAARVARPGGRLLLAELHADAPRRSWQRFVDLTRLPPLLALLFVTATLRPVVRRGVTAAAFRELLDVPSLTGVDVEPDPELAIVWARASRSSRAS